MEHRLKVRYKKPIQFTELLLSDYLMRLAAFIIRLVIDLVSERHKLALIQAKNDRDGKPFHLLESILVVA